MKLAEKTLCLANADLADRNCPSLSQDAAVNSLLLHMKGAFVEQIELLRPFDAEIVLLPYTRACPDSAETAESHLKQPRCWQHVRLTLLFLCFPQVLGYCCGPCMYGMNAAAVDGVQTPLLVFFRSLFTA